LLACPVYLTVAHSVVEAEAVCYFLCGFKFQSVKLIEVMHKNLLPTQTTGCLSTRKTNRLILYSGITIIYFSKLRKYMNTLCSRCLGILNV